MIETQITTIVVCDQCDAQVEIDAGLPADVVRPDLDIVNARALKEAVSNDWMVVCIRHLCPDCADALVEYRKEQSK